MDITWNARRTRTGFCLVNNSFNHFVMRKLIIFTLSAVAMFLAMSDTDAYFEASSCTF
jgi:hypothetical protein